MATRLHFISGLPRSGTTLLTTILRQNPRFHASMSSPLCEIFTGLCRNMSGANEFARFISKDQRLRILRSVFDAYYADFSATEFIFDTNRGWTRMLPGLVELFPNARMLCCVRSPAWILDSFERLVQANILQPPRMFNFSVGDVYRRVEALMNSGLVGTSLAALRQAWFGEHARHLIILRYDSLVEDPTQAIDRVYEALGEQPFEHDFEHLQRSEESFDDWIGLPGLHTVQPAVRVRHRESILPSDLFRRYRTCFWERQGQNPRGVVVV